VLSRRAVGREVGSAPAENLRRPFPQRSGDDRMDAGTTGGVPTHGVLPRDRSWRQDAMRHRQVL
jgi:hypothetical protein